MRTRQHFTWRRFFASRLFFVVGIALLILFSVNLTRAQLKDRAIRSEITKLQEEVGVLEKERQGYEALVALLGKPEFLEKEARRSLSYVKPGEQVVVIEKNAECRTPYQSKLGAGQVRNAECLGQREQRLSNPRKWWIYFFGGR